MNWKLENTKRFKQQLNYTEHFLILASTITGCASISAFAPLLGIPVGFTSSVRIKNLGNSCSIKTYKSIIKEKEVW